jgi:LPXTG-site transpeptidase (sortase) family protein
MAYFRPYKYVKDESYDSIYKSYSKQFLVRSRVLPATLVSLGIFVFLSQILIPLISFKYFTKVTRPVESSVLGVASGFRDYKFSELEENFDSAKKVDRANVPETFYLSVPKLNIENAVVKTNSTDLSPENYVGHYAGSALPGEIGNAFLYGHSVLPMFYNPKSYKTIFSTLNTLEVGDDFVLSYNNNKLRYKVEMAYVLSPEDVNPTENVKPAYLNESTVTLMTCVPPGTKAKRLLVVGTLID